MGDILCVGASHFPGFLYPDEHMADILRRHLASDRISEAARDPRSWPAEMQAEFGPDGSNVATAAAKHRAAVMGAYARIRAEIDAFRPDFMVVWGDDQYENFHEDLVPPFCIYIQPEFVCQPWKRGARWAIGDPDNRWGDPRDREVVVAGHPEGAGYLARGLFESGFALPYAYRELHQQGLAHAFMNTVLYLDYERRGFPYPLVPFHVNCYGSSVMRNRGSDTLRRLDGAQADPPAPSPRLCFDLGAATARVLRDSPWRVVLMGSSSWSHAFLTEKHHYIYPDLEADRQRVDDLRSGRQHVWRDLTIADIEAAGQHEFLNWVPLGGAITELGYEVEVLDFSDSWIFNSSKCAVVARPRVAA